MVIVTRLRFLILAAMEIGTLAAGTIHLKTRDFEPLPDRTDYLASPLLRRTAGTSHYLVEFHGPVTASTFAGLRSLGITVTGYLEGSTVIVSAPDDFSLNGLPVRWVGRLEHRDKMSPLVTAESGARAPHTYLVEFHSDVDMSEARVMVREHGLRLVENPNLATHHLLVNGRFGDFSRLASWDEVEYIFPASPELVAGRKVYRCAGAIVQQTTVAQVAGSGYPWPAGGTSGLALGYFFSQLTEKLPAPLTQSEILRAFHEWSKYANVNFTEAASSQAPQTVNILFARGTHGDPYPFDGPGGVLAHTFYPAPPNPESLAGDMHLDDDERWQVGANTDLFSVALHEAGHALGMVHTDDPNDVMYPYYRMRTTLGSGDVSIVQGYYGVANGAAPAPAPASLALTVQSPAATSTTTASSVSIYGSTAGGSGPVQISWHTDGGYVGNATGSPNWAIASVPLSLGANTITITAFDSSGHAATQTIIVTRESQQPAPQPATPAPAPAPSPTPSPTPAPPPPNSPGDSTPPSLRITYPTATIISTSATTITLKGLATDNVGVTRVTWANSTGSAGNAAGTFGWIASNIPLLQGSNTITIRAFDAAGNSAWRSVMVVRQ